MSVIAIVNHSLALLAVDPITSLTDDTRQSNLANRLYQPLRDYVLEERAWTFATTRAVLTPTAETPAWGFSNEFVIPTDALRVLEVWKNPPQPGQENVTPPVDWNREGQRILADLAKVYIKYTKVITDTSLMSPGFRDCLAYRLAADMCTALTENRSLMVDLNTVYADKLVKSGSIDASQGVRQQKYIGSFVTRR